MLRPDRAGRHRHRAADIQAMTLANLHQDFENIRSTAEMLEAIGPAV